MRPLGVLELVATGGLLPSEVVALKASLHADALEVRLGRGGDGLQLERLWSYTVYVESNSQESPVTIWTRGLWRLGGCGGRLAAQDCAGCGWVDARREALCTARDCGSTARMMRAASLTLTLTLTLALALALALARARTLALTLTPIRLW